MKKNILLLVIVLTLAAVLLVGCNANTGSGDGFKRGYGIGNAAGDNGNFSLTRGRGNGNGNYGRGNGSGNGSGGNGNGYRLPATTYERQVSPAQSPALDNGDTSVSADTRGYGSSGSFSAGSLTLSEMLMYAIQDEYLARAEYVYIISSFGDLRPFSNIVKAEEQHIQQLLGLFNAHNVEAPVDTASSHTAAVSSLAEAYKAGENAEAGNIAMYDAFLKQDLPDDVRIVFESLRGASENHLAAFRNHL